MGKVQLIAIFVFGVLQGSALADFRVWSSKDGGSNVEAKYIQMAGSKVVLEKKDGNRIMVSPSKLSAADQEYLAGVVPPQLKIKVDKDVDDEKLDEYAGYSVGWVRKRQDITISADIRKTNKDKCTQEFKAHLYIIAESPKGNIRRVLEHQKESISFVDRTNAELSASASCEFYERSGFYTDGNEGWKFEGYLIVIEDQNGQIIASDTNKSTYESNLTKIRKNIKNKEGFSL